MARSRASPALVGSTLYIGDYSGRMHAIWARTGRERWSTGTSGSKFGFASGSFYSTPAVGFGRVFAGNTDGKIYSFGAKSGELAWSKSTGGYVYSSPAIVNVDGVGPTVYAGSYDGTMYALDARTGSTRWTAAAGRAHLGRAYPSSGGSRTGRPRLEVHVRRGCAHREARLPPPWRRYNPVVSDGKTIYLTGYNTSGRRAVQARRSNARSVVAQRSSQNPGGSS